MRLNLEVTRWDNPWVRGPSAMWRDSEPFVVNTRGILIHRPKRVNVYNTKPGKPHVSIGYYCGNGVSGNSTHLSFVTDPGSNVLLCQACELRAVMAGLPTAKQITGRHIHLGRLKAIQICCELQEPQP